MSLGRVLVIEGDDAVAGSLVSALEAEGFVVERRSDARSGFQRACELPPDCIVCAGELPDLDGAWVVRRIRTEPSNVAKTPVILVAETGDKAVRQQALAVGVDVYVTRPASNDDIATHVSALVGMSRRLRGVTEAPPSSTSLSAAIKGDLSQFPLASILMMFELERRSGSLDIVSAAGKRAKLLLVDGLFSNTEVAGESRPALETLREVLSWRAGRFAFSPREREGMPEPRGSVGALVLEAMRLEDERNASGDAEIGAADTEPTLDPAGAAATPPPLPPRARTETLQAPPAVDGPTRKR